MKTLKNSILIALLIVMISCDSSNDRSRELPEPVYKYDIRTTDGYWFDTNEYIIEDGWVIFVDDNNYNVRIPVYNVTFIKDEDKRYN